MEIYILKKLKNKNIMKVNKNKNKKNKKQKFSKTINVHLKICKY